MQIRLQIVIKIIYPPHGTGYNGQIFQVYQSPKRVLLLTYKVFQVAIPVFFKNKSLKYYFYKEILQLKYTLTEH